MSLKSCVGAECSMSEFEMMRKFLKTLEIEFICKVIWTYTRSLVLNSRKASKELEMLYRKLC